MRLVPIGRRFARDRRGVAAVEFGLLATVFFALIFAILDTALVFLGQLALDNAVTQAARQVQTGELQQKSISEADFRKLICDRAAGLLTCDAIVIDLKGYGRFSDVPGRIPLTGAKIDSAGLGFDLVGPNSIAALRAFYKWPIDTNFIRAYLSNSGDGSRWLCSVSVFKTEPY